MKNLSLTLAIVLAIGGCTGKPETATAEIAPEAPPAPSPPVTAPAAPMPMPAPAAAATAAPDAELEAAIRATAPDYRADAIGADGDADKARYAVARTDLNGDGKDEVFVYLMGPYFCGSGGCNLLVFSLGGDGYSLLANIATSDPPVVHAESRNEGYADFWRKQSGGGMPSAYVRHTYRRGKYVEAARASADTLPSGDVVLPEATDFASARIPEPKP